MQPYEYGVKGIMDASTFRLSTAIDTVPVIFGTAPVGLVRGLADANVVNEPIVITGMADAQRKLGMSNDFGRYTLCESIAQHFNNPNGNVGPIYCFNVLDPDRHKADAPVNLTLSFARNRAQIADEAIILDSLRLARPVPEGTLQQVAFRDKGTSAGDQGFDYAEAYGKAGVTLRDGVLTYEPTYEIDPHLIHDGKLYVGLKFTKPEGATNVTIKIDGAAVEELDLAKEGEFVNGGNPVEYVAVASEDGKPIINRHLVFECEWTGGETAETVCMVSTGEGRFYQEGEDYELSHNYSTGVTLIEDLTKAMPATVSASYEAIDDDKVEVEDVIGKKTDLGEYSGIHAIDLLFMRLGKTPNILAAPGWSHIPEVGAALAEATRQANGHWESIAILDIPIADAEGEPIDTVAKAIEWKAEHGYDDERTKVYWPMAFDNDGNLWHLSSIATAELVRADQSHEGVPMETNGNKSVAIAGQYFGEGSPNKGFDEQLGDKLCEHGISTIVPWGNDWRLWGEHTAAYEYGDESIDPRCIFETTIRMMLHLLNGFQKRWADSIDEPMSRSFIDSIINVEQEELDNLVSQGALLGTPTIVYTAEDNPTERVVLGYFTWSLEVTPTVPLKSATIRIAYTDDGFVVLTGGE